MGFFDSKWIVEFEYSNGFFSSYKRGTMVVEASSENSAKDTAKSVLRANYSYVKVFSAQKSGGRSEEGRVTFKPPVNTFVKEAPKPTEVHSSSDTFYTSASTSNQNKPCQKLSEDIAEEYVRTEKRDNEFLNAEKQNKIVIKEKELKDIQFAPFKTLIISGSVSFVAFFFGWIPHWYILFQKASFDSMLAAWISLGHSETDPTGQAFVAEIGRYAAKARQALFIPFGLLAFGITLTILLYLLTKKKVPVKLEKARKEYEILKTEKK